jgi:hypothetical protein
MPDRTSDTADRRTQPAAPALDRRRFLARLAGATLAAPLALSAAYAQGEVDHAHDAMHAPGASGAAIGPDLLPAAEIPWDDGTCDFCGMTLRTPANGQLPEGFRERTYGQIRLTDEARVDGRDALHFESLACLHNRAWVEGIRDGHGATFYVADHAAPPEAAGDLLPGRAARYLWAEDLRVSMNARLAAFAGEEELSAAIGALAPESRRRQLDPDLLADLAPLPEMNLVALLARHSGLID